MRTLTAADEIIEAIAARQHGVVSRTQVLAAGLTPSQLRHRLDRREWRRVAPGVVGFPGHPDTHRRRCWIAVLHAGPDACCSHGTAGLLLGMQPLQGQPVELTVGRARGRPLPGTRWHRPRSGLPDRLVRVDGLPVTGPARTLVDLAGQLLVPRLERVVEDAEVTGRCSVGAVGAELARTRRRGRPGVRRLEVVLDRLGPGDGVPRSELERLGDDVRRLAGLPAPHHEHPLPSASGRVGFVDRAWEDALLITELDGRRWHTRRAQLALDHRRDLEAAALGWQTLRLCWEQLRHEPRRTADLWRATYDRRIAQLGVHRPA